MSRNLIKIFDFLQAAGNLKKTLRYKASPKIPKESVADHAWRLALMSFMIAEELKLELDLAKTMKIALAHDLAEAVTGDIDALLIHNKTVELKEKRKLEASAMKKMTSLLPKKTADNIIKLWREYVNRSSEEARYVYAMDKIEALAYLSEIGYQSYHDTSFLPIYADKAVSSFKELKPILKILKNKIKKEYKKGKFEWKKSYDKI